MIKTGSLSLFSCLPLVALLFWQGSSCHSTKSNQSSAANNNHSMNSNSTPSPKVAAKGAWGAQGIVMEVTDNGAEISYDCAKGSITEKIALDDKGHFSVRGRHKGGHPGPTREDEDQSGQPATYRGSISGDTMTLTVTLSDSKETIGTFTLKHGSPGRLRRCL
jgi:hypothetical protein